MAYSYSVSRPSGHPTITERVVETERVNRQSMVSFLELGSMHQEYANKYPVCLTLFLFAEFNERVSFSLINVLLLHYLQDKLMYNDIKANSLYHGFLVFVFVTPMLGAIFADGKSGKFKTIIISLLVVLVGYAVLSVAAVDFMHLSRERLSWVAVFLIACGSGAYKPCGIALAAGQLDSPEQDLMITNLFSWDLMVLTFASLLAFNIAPILKNGVSCFGTSHCYFLPFVFACGAALLGLCTYMFGRKKFKVTKPMSNMMLNFCKCIVIALKNRCKTKPSERNRLHWTDYAETDFDAQQLKDVRGIIRIVGIFLALPVFWGLLSASTEWTLQGVHMDGIFGHYTLKPEHMMLFIPWFSLFLIPAFDYLIYPSYAKVFGNQLSLLARILIGCTALGSAFMIAGFLQLYIEAISPHPPSHGQAQISFYNSLPCTIHIHSNVDNFTIDPLDMYTLNDIDVGGDSMRFYMNNITLNGMDRICTYAPWDPIELTVYNKEIVGVHINGAGKVKKINDSIYKSTSGLPLLRVLSEERNECLVDIYKKDKLVHRFSGEETIFKEVPTVSLNIKLNNEEFISDILFRSGGLYNLMLYENETARLVVSGKPNTVPIILQLPQIFLLSCGELMVTKSSMEFYFRAAPESSRVIVNSLSYLTNAGGHLLFILFNTFVDVELSTRWLIFGIALHLNCILLLFLCNSYRKAVLRERRIRNRQQTYI